MRTRLMAALRKEVSASDLEAYREAGFSAFNILDTIGCEGFNPWTATEQQRIQALCGWIAFALQTAGDALVEADYSVDPATIGFVPEITLRQAVSFYEEVDDWACCAKEAQASPHCQLDTSLPAVWPEWIEIEPCPTQHLAAMLATAERLGERVVLLFDPEAGVKGYQERAVHYIRQLLARGDQRRDRAMALWHGGSASQRMHENMEQEVKAAIAAYFLAGQVMSMPKLVDQAERGEQVAGRTFAIPGDPEFDPWCLTDPRSRNDWRRDRAAQRAIAALWRNDPNPRATLRIQAQIDEALAAGDIVQHEVGSYFCCPWSAVYKVVRRLTIRGKRLSRGKQFTFDVSAEEMSEGGPFKREILVADFFHTADVDYCNPEADGYD